MWKLLCKVKCLKKGNPKKSLVNGNPSYREMIYARGTPRKYKGNSLVREINYTRKPLIHGNSCKVKCLIQQGGASTSEPFREIKCTFEDIKTIGKPKETKTTKEVKEKTCTTTSIIPTKQTNNTTVRPMSPKPDTGLKVELCVCFVGIIDFVVQVFPLTSLVLLVSLVFPIVVDVFKL